MAQGNAAQFSPGGRYNFVVLDRSNVLLTPDFSVSGYARCFHCHHECWLGVESYKQLLNLMTYPICTICATELRKPLGEQEPVQQIVDPEHCPECGCKHLPSDSAAVAEVIPVDRRFRGWRRRRG